MIAFTGCCSSRASANNGSIVLASPQIVVDAVDRTVAVRIALPERGAARDPAILPEQHIVSRINRRVAIEIGAGNLTNAGAFLTQRGMSPMPW